MPRKFGGYGPLSPRRRWEILQELRDNKKNGPVVVSNINDEVNEENEEPSTHEENS